MFSEDDCRSSFREVATVKIEISESTAIPSLLYDVADAIVVARLKQSMDDWRTHKHPGGSEVF